MTSQTKSSEDTILSDIAKATGGIAAILLGIKVLGFVEKVILARYFGTGYQAEAYFLAFGLMITFWDILRGLMDPSYLPTLLEYRAQCGETQSWEFTSTVLNLMTMIFALLTGIGLIFTPQFIRIITENLSEQTFMTTVGLTRLMLTGAGFFALAIITGLTLNSYKRFVLAVMDDVVFKISGLLGLIILGRYIGSYGLAWGIALGSWIAPFLHLIGLRKYFPSYRFRIDMTSAPFRKMMRLIRPLILGTVCIEGRRVIDNRFASRFAGGVSALAYGYKLIEFAYVFIAEPLAVVVLPYFSELAIRKEHDTLADTLFTSVRTVILLFTPMGVCLYMLRYPVVQMLFERGAFDTVSTQLTVTALAYYAFGIVSFATEVLLIRAYFSMSDTLTPAIMEALTLAAHLGLIFALRGTLAHGAIALAFTVSKTLKVLILYGFLKQRLGTIHLSENLIFVGKLLIAAGAMISSMWGYQYWFAGQFPGNFFIMRAVVIITSGGLGAGIFFAIAFWLKIQEVRIVFHAIWTYASQKIFKSLNGRS